STVMRQAGMEPEFDYAGLIAKSEQIRTQHRMLTPVSRTRYSSRTDTRWDVTGFTGAMIVSGDFSELLPLLRMTEIVGAGKLCVMGLGRIKVSALQ
ncbi:MAG: CRISPR system precrRNA processing endoribonuclease RAMP protein Cas6, partial [Oscillospiraceae bacterium]|nr:CRISPR system precrRNA processing endoribonuclease RAMP protein Cas6 [Oscillospiraceae bacterium]